MRLLFLFVVSIIITANISFTIKPKKRFNWKSIDYLWNNSTQKQNAMKSGLYNASSCVLYDVDEAPDGRIFITIIRKKGVPATLTTVSKKTGPGGPLLAPYPNWSWYNNVNCNNHTIINVYRISIKCNYLFVLDSGVIENKTICPPKLLIFDLTTDKLIEYITIPRNIATNDKTGMGLLATPTVDIQNCDLNTATVFMADANGNGLVKYNKRSSLCRIESDFMKPNNTDVTLTVQNHKYNLVHGIFGLTTIYEDLYYALLAGQKIFKMNMHDLRNCSKLNKTKANNLTELAGILSGQTGPIASAGNVLFFSNIPNTSILCANATKQFNSTTAEHIMQDSEKLQYASGLKVTSSGQKLLIATNNLQNFFANTSDVNKINFRVFEINMAQIKKETNCFVSHHNHNPSHNHSDHNSQNNSTGSINSTNSTEHKLSYEIYVTYWYTIYIIDPFKNIFGLF